MSLILIIVLVILVVGAAPTWPYATSWGYYPSSFFGIVLLVVLVLAITGRL